MINDKLKEFTLLAVVLLAVFGVYLRTAFPAFKGDDSPETAVAAYTLGIQHSPGYPVYTLLGKIAVIANLANPAFKVNLLSSLLAVLTLLVTYFILTRHVFKLFGFEQGVYTWVLGFGLLFILAFSNIFWSQAIEAKGGIYMLNLLFLSVLIYLSLEQFQVSSSRFQMSSTQGQVPEPETRNPKLETKFDMKILYIISYVFGLSLANHWPSMIILSPAFACVFYKYRKEFGRKKIVMSLFAFAAGLSAYFYLYLRAGTNPSLNWGSPDTFGRLIDIIMRKMYEGRGEPLTAAIIGGRAAYLFKSIFSNYSFICLLALPGFFAVHKKQRAVFWIFLYIAAVTAAMLVFYDRTGIEMVWLMGIFLMPAQYALFIFIAAGAAFTAGLMKTAWQKGISAAVIAALAVLLLNLNMAKNDRHADYISYDIMHNILSSVGSRAYYLSEHDMYLMPMLYEKNVQKRGQGLKFFLLPFLFYDWGIKQAQAVFGYFPSKTGDVLYNLAGVVGIAMQDTGDIYRDFTSPAFDALKLPLFQGYAGLIKRVSPGPSPESTRIYELYSFRGIYEAFAQSDENIEIVTRYLIFMSMHAERLMQLTRYREAISLYEKALRIPAEKLAYNIYFNMAKCHLGLNDRDNALACLNKAMEEKKDFLPAYEAAGRIYYEKNDIFNAGKFFTQAVMLGSTDGQVKELEATARITITQNEAELAAAAKLSSKKQYKQAIKIYSTLVKLDYRAADVCLRMGQLYYGLGDRDKALAMLIDSNKREINPGAYYYQAMIYMEKGMPAEAKSAVYEGLTRFKDDKRLRKMYSELRGK